MSNSIRGLIYKNHFISATLTAKFLDLSSILRYSMCMQWSYNIAKKGSRCKRARSEE